MLVQKPRRTDAPRRVRSPTPQPCGVAGCAVQGHCGCWRHRARSLAQLETAKRQVRANRKELAFADAVAAATEELVASGELAAASVGVYVGDWQDLVGFVAASGCRSAYEVEHTDRLIERFVHAKDGSGHVPTVASMHRRRAAVRCLWRHLRAMGAAFGDPTADLHLPPRSSRPTRALTDDEMALCEWASSGYNNSTRYPAIWALAEAGASMTEMPWIALKSLDLDGALVALDGGSRLRPRFAPLTDWGVRALRCHVQATGLRGDDTTVVYHRRSEDDRSPTLIEPVRKVLEWAGILDEPDLNPSEAARGWLGAAVFSQTRSIEAVANALGLASLDRAAELICHDWQENL